MDLLTQKHLSTNLFPVTWGAADENDGAWANGAYKQHLLAQANHHHQPYEQVNCSRQGRKG